jgi:hypothetical protein
MIALYTPPFLHFITAALSLAGQGYEMGPPARIAAESLAIDREVAAESACPSCRRVGLKFEPFHRVEDGSYVGLAVCPSCHHATEF